MVLALPLRCDVSESASLDFEVQEEKRATNHVSCWHCYSHLLASTWSSAAGIAVDRPVVDDCLLTSFELPRESVHVTANEELDSYSS